MLVQPVRILLSLSNLWAEKHKWMEGTEDDAPANKLTCGQTYLELYFLKEQFGFRIKSSPSYYDLGKVASESVHKGSFYFLMKQAVHKRDLQEELHMPFTYHRE